MKGGEKENKAVFKRARLESDAIEAAWPVSLCQHSKSRDTWHLELHQDELIGGSTQQLSSY